MRQTSKIIDNVRGGSDALLHLLFDFPIFQSVMDIANYRSKYETAFYNAISVNSDIPETIVTADLNSHLENIYNAISEDSDTPTATDADDLKSHQKNIRSNKEIYNKIIEILELPHIKDPAQAAQGLIAHNPQLPKTPTINPSSVLYSKHSQLAEVRGAASKGEDEVSLPHPIDFLVNDAHPNYHQFLIKIAEIFELCKNDARLTLAILKDMGSEDLKDDQLIQAIKSALHYRWKCIDEFVMKGYREISGLILQDEKTAEDISQIIFNIIDQVVNLHVTINHNCFLHRLPTSAVQSITHFKEQYLVQMLLLVAKSSNKELAADLKSFTHKILQYNKSQLLALRSKLRDLESTLKERINNQDKSPSLKTILSTIEQGHHSVILNQYLDAFQADHKKTSKNAFLKFVFEQETQDPQQPQPIKELLQKWYENKVTTHTDEREQFNRLLTSPLTELPATLKWVRDYPEQTTPAYLKQEYASNLLTFVEHDIALLSTDSLGDFISATTTEEEASLAGIMNAWEEQIKQQIKRSSEPQETIGNEGKREASPNGLTEEYISTKLAQQIEEHKKALMNAVHKYHPTTAKEELTLAQAQNALKHLSRAQHSAYSTVFATVVHLGATPTDIDLPDAAELITSLTSNDEGGNTPQLKTIISEAINDLKANKELITTTHQAQDHLITHHAKRISDALPSGTPDANDACAKIIFFLKERLVAENQTGQLTFNERWAPATTKSLRIEKKDIASSFFRTKLAVTEYLSPDASFQSIISRLKPDSPQIADVISTLSEHADPESIELSEEEHQAFSQIHPNAFTQPELIYNLGIRWCENDPESTPSDSIQTAVALKKFLTQRAEDARQATEKLTAPKLIKYFKENWSTSKESFNFKGFFADVIGQEKIKKFDDRYYRATPSAANNFMILTIAAVVFFATAIPTVVILWETGTLTLTPALAVGSLIGSSILLATHHLINFFKKTSGLDAVICDIDALHSQFIPERKQHTYSNTDYTPPGINSPSRRLS